MDFSGSYVHRTAGLGYAATLYRQDNEGYRVVLKVWDVFREVLVPTYSDADRLCDEFLNAMRRWRQVEQHDAEVSINRRMAATRAARQ